MLWLRFMRKWLGVALDGTVKRTELACFVLAALIDGARHLFPQIAIGSLPWLWSLPFWVFGIVVLWNFVRAPFLIWRADQAEIARLQPLRSDEGQRREQLAKLAEFITEGENLRRDFEALAGDARIIAGCSGWSGRVSAYLSVYLDPSHAAQFESAHGNAAMGMPVGRSVVGGGYWQEIGGKNEYLSGLVTELRRH